MSDSGLPVWVKYLQVLVTPAITIVGSGLVRLFALARSRMQLDLYDLRYKIFESEKQLIVTIMREATVQNEDIFANHREVGEAIFLLDHDVSRVTGTLEMMW